MGKATRRNRNLYRFTVLRCAEPLFDVCGKTFQRGKVSVVGTLPFPSQLNAPTLPDITTTGNQHGGFHHLAGPCPKHTFDSDGKFMGIILQYTGEPDSDNSSDGPNNSAVVPPEELSTVVEPLP